MLGEREVKAVQALEIIIIILPCWKVKHSFRKMSSTGSSEWNLKSIVLRLQA
jgi:hypothetical protein